MILRAEKEGERGLQIIEPDALHKAGEIRQGFPGQRPLTVGWDFPVDSMGGPTCRNELDDLFDDLSRLAGKAGQRAPRKCCRLR
jgi:hypothetical protein